MSRFELDASELDRLQRTMAAYEGDVESAVNDVLHNDASQMLQQEITRLMPVSGRHWTGKKGSAKSSGSLRDEKSNLAVTIKTKTAYNYLYRMMDQIPADMQAISASSNVAQRTSSRR